MRREWPCPDSSGSLSARQPKSEQAIGRGSQNYEGLSDVCASDVCATRRARS